MRLEHELERILSTIHRSEQQDKRPLRIGSDRFKALGLDSQEYRRLVRRLYSLGLVQDLTCRKASNLAEFYDTGLTDRGRAYCAEHRQEPRVDA
jgi:hypothetical protein